MPNAPSLCYIPPPVSRVQLFQLPGGLPDRFAYRAQQASLLHLFIALHRRFGILRERSETEVDAPTLNEAYRRYSALLERDILNVREGLYPRELLFEIPIRTYARALPRFLKNAPSVVLRRIARNFMDFPCGVDLEPYPPYYRQNFHWQTDGYLSRRSAEIYDIGVEMLFLGTADIMRRQVIPPITRFLAEQGREGARLLDVGCGTGRTLLQVASSHPQLRLFGVDLSPYYVDLASDTLRDFSRVSLMAANGEDLPFRDGYFDVATSVFTFHELPRDVRRRVLKEMHRVLRPGGLLIVEDSAQMKEARELSFFMKCFVNEFHEPYYEDYLTDDLEQMFARAGVSIDSVEPHFVAKVVAGRKIARGRSGGGGGPS